MPHIKNLALSGGGVSGFAYIGLLRGLEELNMLSNIENYAGASIGAIFSTMFSIGYTHSELYDFVKSFEYEMVSDIQILGFLENFGFETGDKMERFIQIMIHRKTGKLELTFAQHYEITKKKLYISAACLNTGKVEYFSVDNTPDMPVFLALRISVAIPFMIAPVRWQEKLYTDSCILENIPCNCFVKDKKQTLVVELVPDNKGQPVAEINSIETYAKAVIKTMYTHIQNMKRDMDDCENYQFLNIDTGKYHALYINLTKSDRKKIYRAGYKAVMKRFQRANSGLVKTLIQKNDQIGEQLEDAK